MVEKASASSLLCKAFRLEVMEVVFGETGVIVLVAIFMTWSLIKGGDV
jgi:hypothetical protein